MKNNKYGMVTMNSTIIDTNGDYKSVQAGDIVRVVSLRGTIAIIKPYNSKKMYAIDSQCINTNITQNIKDYQVVYGVRRLRV